MCNYFPVNISRLFMIFFLHQQRQSLRLHVRFSRQASSSLPKLLPPLHPSHPNWTTLHVMDRIPLISQNPFTYYSYMHHITYSTTQIRGGKEKGLRPRAWFLVWNKFASCCVFVWFLIDVRETIAHYASQLYLSVDSELRVDEANTSEPLIFGERVKAAERLATLTSTLYTASFPFSWSVNLWASGNTALLTEEWSSAASWNS